MSVMLVFVSINQTLHETYLKNIEFENCKDVHAPIDVSYNGISDSEQENPFDTETYQSAVGRLLYVATEARPDLSFAVSNASK